jgi:hypothetical protein
MTTIIAFNMGAVIYQRNYHWFWLCQWQDYGKGKAITVQAYYRPRRFQEVEAPRFRDNQHVKEVRLSALRRLPLASPFGN